MVLERVLWHVITFRFNQAWQTLRNRPIRGSIEGVSGLLIGLGLFGGYYFFSKGEKVFDCIIDEQRVNYVEGEGLFSKRNIITIHNGRESYRLIDSSESTNIDWQLNSAPSFNSDVLESVIIEKASTEEIFNRDDVSDLTLKGQKAKNFLNTTTKYYNGVRNLIRDKKRADYSDNLKNSEEFFNNYIRSKGL